MYNLRQISKFKIYNMTHLRKYYKLTIKGAVQFWGWGGGGVDIVNI